MRSLCEMGFLCPRAGTLCSVTEDRMVPPPRVSDMLAWIGGSVLPLRDARIPVNDHGFLYGDSVYETVRTFQGELFRLSDHLRRLRTTARGLRIPIEWSDPQLAGWVEELRGHLPVGEHYIRLLVTRGPGEFSYAPDPSQKPTLMILGGPFQATAREVLEKGLAAVTVGIPRSVPNPRNPGLKTGNLLNSRLAFFEAIERGADEALLLTRSGHLAEGSSSNLFLILPGEVLATPSIESEILEGVTRTVLLELAREMGLEVREEELPAECLAQSEEAFLSSTSRSVAPLRSIDGRELGCPGPVTRRLMDGFIRLAGGL